MRAQLAFIGHIETPYQTLEECPRNIDPNGAPCRLVVESQYEEGLLGLGVGREILVLYWLEHGDRTRLRQSPPHIGKLTGTFALRSPHRPNPIGAAVVTIDAISGNTIAVRGLDCVNGTPLLDIKPAMGAERAQ
jgi:tRNA-Thr(GGU) m(6)t(6)A37 methyltransferase TsaA